MNILYGIQGTGNGHISRARMIARHFGKTDVAVDYLFTGRDRSAFFDMEVFGNYQHRRGLTFHSENGKVSYPKTVLKNNIFQFIRDVVSLDLDKYDLVITDFEPVSAWAARLRSKEVLGIGHQYAFGHQIPRAGNNPVAALTMRYFAPTSDAVGLHWDNFGSAILPPIIDNTITRWDDDSCSEKKIVVYLPFENQQFVQSLFHNIEGYRFIIYSPDLVDTEQGNIALRKTSYSGFKRDLTSACAVICNSGFELISECLHLGLSILTKPQAAQMEQQSNAAALRQLNYATTVDTLDSRVVKQWLTSIADRPPIKYPDVASAIVDWIIDGRQLSAQSLSDKLWSSVPQDART